MLRRLPLAGSTLRLVLSVRRAALRQVQEGLEQVALRRLQQGPA